MVEGVEGGAGEEVHVGGGFFPPSNSWSCVWGGGEGEREGELAVIARVVGEGAAYPLTHFFPALRLAVMCGGEGWGELAVKATVRGMGEGGGAGGHIKSGGGGGCIPPDPLGRGQWAVGRGGVGGAGTKGERGGRGVVEGW